MSLLGKLFGHSKSSPDKAHLRRIKGQFEECLGELTRAQTEEQISSAISDVSRALRNSAEMPPDVKAIGVGISALSSAGSPVEAEKNRDVVVRKLLEFVRQINGILAE